MANISEITRTLHERRNRYRNSENTKTPLGVDYIDKAVGGGVDLITGGIYTISGASGSRKTSMVLNLICNMCINGLPSDTEIYIDTLESGMTIEKYTETLVSIVATKLILNYFFSFDRALTSMDILPLDLDYAKELLKKGIPQKVSSGKKSEEEIVLYEDLDPETILDSIGYINSNGKFIKLLGLLLSVSGRENKAYIKYQTPLQRNVVNLATQIVAEWPININGLSETKHLTYKDIALLDKSKDRWLSYTEGCKQMILIIDHISTFDYPSSDGNSNGNDYVLMKAVKNAVKETMFKSKGAKVSVWLIEQAGVTGQNLDPKNLVSTPHSRGGDITREEANLAIFCKYDTIPKIYPHPRLKKDVVVMNKYSMLLIAKKGRAGEFAPARFGIEPYTGTILGTVDKLYPEYVEKIENYLDDTIVSDN